MKAIETIIDDKTFYLVYNAEAMFTLQDLFGEENIIDAIAPMGRSGYEATLKVVAVLAEQGELARRLCGHDRGQILMPNALKVLVLSPDVISLKQDILDAINLGLKSEVDAEDKVVDLGLAELQKKTV